HLALGLSAMAAGDLKEAERRFRASVKAKPDASAFMQLGLLCLRTGRTRDAMGYFQQALQLPVNASDRRSRTLHAELLGHLRDAAGDVDEVQAAQKAYAQSLAEWEKLLPASQGPDLAAAELRRGTLLHRLGKPTEAERAFEAAMRAAPRRYDT